MDKALHERLIALIKKASVPIDIKPASLPKEWEPLCYVKPLQGIKAVLFDVYGTLFSSAAGDISLAAKDTGENDALEELAGIYGLTGVQMRSYFREQVAAIHRSLDYTTWPEVRVEEIWTGFLVRQGIADNAAEQGMELALAYELAVNPVYPMNSALKAINSMREAGVLMGIISNAQFFTPLLFEALLGALPEKLGFDPGLIIWSFEHGEAKPSPLLYEKAAQLLKERGISAAECAFVGNDMLSDIYGAMNVGFKGVLFAGDERSLRLRESNERVAGLRPSLIIRNLGELSLNLLPV
jgi:putative hydrolase of the HAD superfamily